MRIINNLIRLRFIYIPMFLCAFLNISLYLLSGCIYTSCEKTKEEFKFIYPVTMQIMHKERKTPVYNDEGIRVIVDINSTKVDSNIISFLEDNEYIYDFEYMTPKCTLSLVSIISKDKYDIAIKNSEKNLGFELPYITVSDMNYTECSFRGFTSYEEFLNYLSFDKNVTEVTVTGNIYDFENGVVLPLELYNDLGKPSEIILGWYEKGTRKINVEYVNEDGELVITGYDSEGHLTYIKNLIEMTLTDGDTPKAEAKVIGYYTGNTSSNIVYSGTAIWKSADIIQRYYGGYLDKNTLDYVYGDPKAEEKDPIDIYGLEYVTAKIKDPSKAQDILQSFLNAGYSPDDYNIVITDYDYKFAVAQIEGLQKLAESASNASVIIGILITAILIYFISRRRSGEIYTLRTLGETRVRIVTGMTAEIATVIILAVLTGIIFGELFGNTVCAYINDITLKNASRAADRLSEAFKLMKNKDEVISQMISAIESFNKADIGITYSVENKSYLLLCLASVSAIVYSALSLLAQSFKNLMKERGN